MMTLPHRCNRLVISDWHKECLLDGDILAALYPSLDQTVFLTVYSKPFPGVDKVAVAASLQETAALICFHLSLYVVSGSYNHTHTHMHTCTLVRFAGLF